MEKTTITIRKDTLERFNELKAEAGEESHQEPSANLFLEMLITEWTGDDPDDTWALSGVVTQDIIDEIAATVDDTGLVDDSKVAREVAGQIDYTHLADRVADEVERRMR